MKKFTIVLLGIVGFCSILFMYVLGTYNGYVRGEETVDTAWGTVETQYQRRYDLIPGLVNSTKGAMSQEREVFGAIADARTKYAQSTPGSDARIAAMGGLDSAIGRLLVVMENYPELRSNETIQGLMDELAGTENRIQVARERYNGHVREWNIRVRTMPRALLANLFGFDERTLFESDEGSENAVPVDLTL